MEISALSDWFGIVGGLALAATSMWKIARWFREKIIDAEEGAKLGEELVTELLNRATSPARRADIHAFIQFRCIETEANQTHTVMLSISMAYGTVFIGIFLAIADRFFVTSAMPWLWRFSIASYAALIIAFAMALFFSRQLRVLNRAWHVRAGNVLQERAFKHAET